jgi:hypothetical protein
VLGRQVAQHARRCGWEPLEGEIQDNEGELVGCNEMAAAGLQPLVVTTISAAGAS